MADYVTASNGSMRVIFTGGSVASGMDASRFYYGRPISEVDWGNTMLGTIAAKVGCGNRWVLRHYAYYKRHNNISILKENGNVTNVFVGNGSTFDFGGNKYARSEGAPNQLNYCTAFNSQLNCTSGGSVAFIIGTEPGYSDEIIVSKDTYNGTDVRHVGGEACDFRATPNTHYRVKRWTLNGSQVAGSTNNAQITFGAAAANVNCEFEQYEWQVYVKVDNPTAGYLSSTSANGSWVESGEVLDPIKAVLKDSVNYRFLGWYKGFGSNLAASACNTLVTTDTELTITGTNQSVTYCAKFASRKTTLDVSTDCGGVFDVYINDEVVKSNGTSYTNANARDGWGVRVVAKQNDGYVFSHWLVPLGQTNTQSVYEADYSMELPARADNSFKAVFTQKKVVAITGSVTGIGKVIYDGDLSKGGEFTNAAQHTTTDTFVATDYSFVAIETSKLYAFDHWEKSDGGAFETVSEGEHADSWLRKVEGTKAFVNVPVGSESSTRNIRAVFVKRTTYTIAEPVVQGIHPINRNTAAGDGCKSSGLPPADETVGSVDRWLPGTIQIDATPTQKWRAVKIIVGKAVSGEKEYAGSSASIVVDENIDYIHVVFEPTMFKVKTLVDASSAGVGRATFRYKREDGSDDEGDGVDEDILVYVDTAITINAVASNAKSSFYDWKLNDVETAYGGEAEITIAGDSEFVARFASEITLSAQGAHVENSVSYPLGYASMVYTDSTGMRQTITLPNGKEVSKTVSVVCGSTLSFSAEDESGETSTGTAYQGHFQGWFEESSSAGVWNQITTWGAEVSDIVVTGPRAIRANFSKSNVWPILKLKNPDGYQFCSFTVAGVRTEREQMIDNESVKLTDPETWFCDQFSTVQIRINKFNASDRFMQWNRYNYDTGVVVEAPYSTDQDISVFVTGNTFLRPVFYVGTPITISASRVTGVDSTFGDVSVEGETLDADTEASSSAQFIQGDKATFVASPRNGYKFDGWYSTADGTVRVSEESRYTIDVQNTQTLYAKFVQDTNAIYAFGTSRNPKTMTWKSKRFVLNQPTVFSSALVDAAGYHKVIDGVSNGITVSLSVYHASSPGQPLLMKPYEITNSNSRRLSYGARGERMFEFEVKGNVPVNYFSVATSVSALIYGEGQNNG